MISIWILGDQLMLEHPALHAAYKEWDKSKLCVLMIESKARLQRLPYHRKKLVLLLSAMRHYAADLQTQGYLVDYRCSPTTLEAMKAHVAKFQPEKLIYMGASEHRGRVFQAQLPNLLGVPVQEIPNTQFLTGHYDPFPAPQAGKRYILENFYRVMRRKLGLLIEPNGKPVGGQWNFDALNRQPLPRGMDFPDVIKFSPDELTCQVMQEVKGLESGTGNVDDFNLAVTHSEATRALNDFLQKRLASFGPYEDAMTQKSGVVFHSFLSPYLNIGLLEPSQMVQAVLQTYEAGSVPINSAEGFIRQIIGWREYIYWQYWRLGESVYQENFWNAQRDLPEFFWNGRTDMNCLRRVIHRVLEQGYAHHIERLMLVSNYCLLAGINPQQVNHWFLSCFIDAYEWVMLPNVFGMGLFADGGQVATKPYIASANYINRMSDYCRGCGYQHKKRTGEDACPYNFLYWNFLIEHEALLRANPRMGPNVLGLSRIGAEECRIIQVEANTYLDQLIS